MKIMIVYYSFFRQALERKAEELELTEGKSLRELIDLLIEQYGSKLRDLLLAGDALSSSVLLFVNSKLVKDINMCLREGDEVSFFYAVAGG